MAYLEEFQRQIQNKDFNKFYHLWEEYCSSDTVEGKEYSELLQKIKRSDFALPFGKFTEMGIPLWQTIQDENDSYEILKLFIDLQTTNTATLAQAAYDLLQKKHGSHPRFLEFIRLVGLRDRVDFRGSISYFDLLIHMVKGSCIYHAGGWGTGEIMDVSFIREEVVIEFEKVKGKRNVTFTNASKTLVPLSSTCFRARRFVDPDQLEAEARKDPVKAVVLLLEDLGPLSAAEIKDEMAVLVIPEEDWTKWWQSARSRLKKNTYIETPDNLRDPFRLRKSEVTHEERFNQEMKKNSDAGQIIQTTYNFVRDLPNMLKKEDVRSSVREKILALLEDPDITPSQQLQISIFMEHMLEEAVPGKELKTLIPTIEKTEDVVNSIEIVAFKKRALVAIREFRSDWIPLFLALLISVDNNPLRDYIVKELNEGPGREELIALLKEIKEYPKKYPEVFLWYFQKVIKSSSEQLPFSDKEGQTKLLETLLILMHELESDPDQRDLLKKLYTTVTAKRFVVIRQIIEGCSLDFIKEFLLLSAKTHVFNDHDKKILQSLAEVVHPSLAEGKKKEIPEFDLNIIWTTEEGYRKTHDRIKEISTIEMIQTAKEIEEARAHGDLRENAEYKFALEKRSRLQSEMRRLSGQINRARIITELDMDPQRVSIGNVVAIEDTKGTRITYTILGPWDADPERNVLSVQSQFARCMIGCSTGDEFDFKDETFKIIEFRSFFQNK